MKHCHAVLIFKYFLHRNLTCFSLQLPRDCHSVVITKQPESEKKKKKNIKLFVRLELSSNPYYLETIEKKISYIHCV